VGKQVLLPSPPGPIRRRVVTLKMGGREREREICELRSLRTETIQSEAGLINTLISLLTMMFN
jgi:hypothetical protein